MGRLDRHMQMVAIMQEFGWTYQEYRATPTFVTTLILEKMKRDAKERELASKRTNRGN